MTNNKFTVTVRNEAYDLYRVNNDVNGNPRYVIHFLALGLKDYKSTKATRDAGLSIYRGKWFGGGFVFTSYNVQDSLEWILDQLNEV